MEDEDYRDLIEIVKSYMREYALQDLAEDSNFIERDSFAGGELKLPPPRKHLILLLEAFLFHLKWTDRKTVQNSLNYLQESVENGPTNALIAFPDRAASRLLYLNELPSLGALRDELENLILALRGGDYEPSPRMRR